MKQNECDLSVCKSSLLCHWAFTSSKTPNKSNELQQAVLFATVPCFNMSKLVTIKEGLPHRNNTELNKYLQGHGVSVSAFTVLKSSLIEIAAAVEAMTFIPVERQN